MPTDKISTREIQVVKTKLFLSLTIGQNSKLE